MDRNGAQEDASIRIIAITIPTLLLVVIIVVIFSVMLTVAVRHHRRRSYYSNWHAQILEYNIEIKIKNNIESVIQALELFEVMHNDAI